jgi:hypothetical protein
MPQNENGNKIKNEILAFYGSIVKDPNHRYRSWEHCYGYFQKHASLDHDIASLHLAFYLASWGMYRGSTALLWKDYRIHKLAVSKLLDAKYRTLWNLHLGDSGHDNTTAELIISLSNELKKIYRKQITHVNGTKKNYKPSEILITKILLGTVGCTPACDNFFVVGFRKKQKYSRFRKKFLCQVFQFYRDHEPAFLETQKAIKEQGGIYYPSMKLVDMYFWKLGIKSRTRRRKIRIGNSRHA